MIIMICLDDLGIRDVIITKLTEGTGTVRTQHGVLPVPVPAVVNIAGANGVFLPEVYRETERAAAGVRQTE